MLLIVARCTVKPACRAAYSRLAQQLAAASAAEEGCLSFRLLSHHTRPNDFAFVEEWRDQAALDAHGQTAHFQELVPQLRAMRESAEMDVYEA